MRKAADWDVWWEQRIANLLPGFEPLLTPVEGLQAVQVAPWLWRHGFRRVLVAGNGISLVPRALAHCGLDVVALDISGVATSFAEAHALTEREWEFFFQLNEEGDVGNFRDEYHQPHGRVRFSVGDFLDATCEPGPFDWVISWRSTQHLPAQEAAAALRCIHGRLSSIGSWHITIQNSAPQWREAVDVLEELGYIVNPDPWPRTGRFVWGGIASG